MTANGLVAVGCRDKCVVILDSNSDYIVKQKIDGLVAGVRDHSHLLCSDGAC